MFLVVNVVFSRLSYVSVLRFRDGGGRQPVLGSVGAAIVEVGFFIRRSLRPLIRASRFEFGGSGHGTVVDG